MIFHRFRLRRALLAILGTVVMPILFNLLSTDLQSAWDHAMVGTARKVASIRQHPTKCSSEVEPDIVIAPINDQGPGASDRVLQAAIAESAAGLVGPEEWAADDPAIARAIWQKRAFIVIRWCPSEVADTPDQLVAVLDRRALARVVEETCGSTTNQQPRKSPLGTLNAVAIPGNVKTPGTRP